MTVAQLLNKGKTYLLKHKIPQSALDAELLLMEAVGFSRVQLYTKSQEEISQELRIKYEQLLEQRVQGIPVQYLKGAQEFMGLLFRVTPAVLIPRPDTEILVETVIAYDEEENFQMLGEIGTGSGCISISLCHYLPNVQIVAGDISKEALQVAKQNAGRLQVSQRMEWIESNLFQSFSPSYRGRLDAIVSNPPYIPTTEIPELMREVREYEPYHALDGGMDGLDFYRRIIQEGHPFLKPEGLFFFEVGKGQAPEVAYLLRKAGYGQIEIKKDLAGIERVVIGRGYI
ncbi:MAG: peptide chain release factor N(5)-glutamine methyltransferase [Epulopiscium sp.]|mgnify:CR=1 FL=1|nr:peptide chain release factor N(5)-glutamine methyltransferase [Candidatus Epulonipiscium sp.]